MPKEYYTNLTIRFFVDELSTAEREDLMDWVTQAEENYELFKEIERTLDKTAELPGTFDSQTGFYRVARRLKFDVQPKPNAFRKMWAVAAVISLLTLGGAFFALQRLPLSPERVQAPRQEYQEFRSPKGQRAIMKFPDGTQVVLNAGSTILYPKHFSGTKREVTLVGEAYFEVSPDPARPFIVRSGELDTRVLGTSFNIKAFPNDDLVQVTVTSGRVAVEKKAEYGPADLLANLFPNQQLSYQKKTKVAQVSDVKAAEFVAWKDSRIVFLDQSFEQIAKSLSRTYNVTLLYDRATMGKCRFTSRFDAKASLAEVLRALSIAGDFQYEVKGSTVIIKSKGC